MRPINSVGLSGDELAEYLSSLTDKEFNEYLRENSIWTDTDEEDLLG